MPALLFPFYAHNHPFASDDAATTFAPRVGLVDWSKLGPNPAPYAFPPEGNLVGDVARFTMRFAYRIVPEIALAAALAFIAGIVGRNFNVSNTGLNIYLLFVGPSGIGKDNAVSAMQSLLTSAAKVNGGVPNDPIFNFIGPEQFGSAQGLIKELSKQPVMVAPMGEFGLTLERMVGPNSKPIEKELGQKLLSLYSKSGAGQFFTGYALSNRDNSVQRFAAPALTIFGEGTPEKINENVLSRESLRSGLASRLTLVQFDGETPYRNQNRDATVPAELAERINSIARMVMMNMVNLACIDVPFASDDVQALAETFDDFCVDQKNANRDDAAKELWTRTALKALKLAALLAVADNPWNPAITAAHMAWAQRFELYSIEKILRRFEAGEAGEVTEDARVRCIISAIRKYLIADWPEISNTAGKSNSNLHRERIVTYSFLHRTVAKLKPFKEVGYRNPADALKKSLQVLTERGELVEISRAKMSQDYSYSGIAYMVARPEVFLE